MTALALGPTKYAIDILDLSFRALEIKTLCTCGRRNAVNIHDIRLLLVSLIIASWQRPRLVHASYIGIDRNLLLGHDTVFLQRIVILLCIFTQTRLHKALSVAETF